MCPPMSGGRDYKRVRHLPMMISSVWLECPLSRGKVTGSNPVLSTNIFSYGEMVSRLTVNQLFQVRVLVGEQKLLGCRSWSNGSDC